MPKPSMCKTGLRSFWQQQTSTVLNSPKNMKKRLSWHKGRELFPDGFLILGMLKVSASES